MLAVALACGGGMGGCGDALSTASLTVQQNYQAQRAYGEGWTRFEARDYAAAIPYFRQALALQPDLDEAEADLAWSYYYLGNTRQATLHFRRTLTRQPKWTGLYNGLGWSRFRVGRYSLAIEAFEQALALDSQYRDAAIGLAYSYFELGRYAEALPHLERLTRDSEATPFRKATPDAEEIRSRLAWTYFYVHEYREAAQEFRKGIAVHPAWYGLYDGLGWSYVRLGERRLARDSFHQALALKPEYPDARDGLQAVTP